MKDRDTPDPWDQLSSRESFFEWLPEKSDAHIRAALESRLFVDDAAHAAREYLHIGDEIRTKYLDHQARMFASASLAAAEAAAKSAQRSAFWTAVAAGVSALGAVATAWQTWFGK
jgi:hypothetical protein